MGNCSVRTFWDMLEGYLYSSTTLSLKFLSSWDPQTPLLLFFSHSSIFPSLQLTLILHQSAGLLHQQIKRITCCSSPYLLTLWFQHVSKYFMLWWDCSVLILTHRTTGSSTDPQRQAHRLLSLLNNNMNQSHAGDLEAKPTMLKLTMVCLGDMRRVGWPEMPLPQRWPGAELNEGWPGYHLLPTSHCFPLFSAWLWSMLPGNSMYLASLQESPWEPLLSSGSISKCQGNRGLQLRFRSTGILTFQNNTVTKSIGNKRGHAEYLLIKSACMYQLWGLIFDFFLFLFSFPSKNQWKSSKRINWKAEELIRKLLIYLLSCMQ